MCARLGIDKLAFLLPASDVEISPDFPATIENPVNAATGELLDNRALYVAGGVPRTGRVAHFNSKNYQFSVNHHRDGSGSVCTVHFSAGAFSKSNLEPLDKDRCMDVTALVQRDLAENGVGLDLSSARVTRVDIAQNVKLSHPVACYAPALAAVGARKRTRKLDFGGTGFVTGNKQWEIGLYDKGAQMRELGYSPDLCPENTIRPELRLMKSRLIKQSLGCSTLPELREAWPELKPVYSSFLERDVFRPKLEACKGASIDWYGLAAYVRDENVARSWHRFKSDGLTLLMVLDLGVDLAKHFVASELGYDAFSVAGRRQIERIHVELDRAAFTLKMQGTTPEGHKVVELYDELKERVLRLAA